MSHHFFAYISRMKLISRWGLMRNTVPENIQEHSLQVAAIAHALALIGNKYYGGDADPARTALLAVYHDVGEVLIGDLPTPVKYFNPQIKEAYGQIEQVAKEKLLSHLPPELAGEFRELFFPAQDKSALLVKAADKIAAYLKCLEEEMTGNGEFAKAGQALKREIEKYYFLPEVERFMTDFAGSFTLPIDEMD
ncbi:MAG: 5'-deoxynucleotidase [Clostridiales bacterium]|nr:5'-deoxynucleotidase [Clostridiales bacterium]